LDYYINKKLEMVINVLFTGVLVLMSYFLFIAKTTPKLLFIIFVGLIIYRLIYGFYILSKSRKVLRNLYFWIDYLIFPILIVIMLIVNLFI